MVERIGGVADVEVDAGGVGAGIAPGDGDPRRFRGAQPVQIPEAAVCLNQAAGPRHHRPGSFPFAPQPPALP